MWSVSNLSSLFTAQRWKLFEIGLLFEILIYVLKSPLYEVKTRLIHTPLLGLDSYLRLAHFTVTPLT